MPIFMDRHQMPEGITAKELTDAHHADMHAQNKHDVNFLTFWFDPNDGCVFCIAEAPDAEAINSVHGEAHGNIPHDIVEVNLNDVEAFMGRIEDPEKDDEGHLKIENPIRCIMFTDLEGSTDMILGFGDAEAVRLFEIHDALVREAILENNGREVKHTGDGFLISFDHVIDAVNASIKIQNSFKKYTSEKPDRPLRVRIGLNAGQPIERGADLFGVVVNLAARFCDHAQPEQILATGIIYQFLEGKAGFQEKFNELEKSYFKGFAHATQVYEINW